MIRLLTYETIRVICSIVSAQQCKRPFVYVKNGDRCTISPISRHVKICAAEIILLSA